MDKKQPIRSTNSLAIHATRVTTLPTNRFSLDLFLYKHKTEIDVKKTKVYSNRAALTRL